MQIITIPTNNVVDFSVEKLRKRGWDELQKGGNILYIFCKNTSLLAPFHKDVILEYKHSVSNHYDIVIDHIIKEVESQISPFFYINLFIILKSSSPPPKDTMLKRKRVQITLALIGNDNTFVISQNDWAGKGLSDIEYFLSILQNEDTCYRFSKPLLTKAFSFLLVSNLVIALLILLIILLK